MGSTGDIAQIQASGTPNKKVNLQHPRLNPEWPRGWHVIPEIGLVSGCPKIWDLLSMRIGAEMDGRRTGDLLELR